MEQKNRDGLARVILNLSNNVQNDWSVSSYGGDQKG